MKVDVTSMFFNSSIEGKTATAAWGTSIGQNSSKSCKIETEKDGIIDFVIGMTYKSTTNFDTLDISKGSSNRELLMLSSFDKVYINNKVLKDSKYHVILVKELSKSHYGRLIISYAPYITYDGCANQETIIKMQKALGCSDDGCWFVYDISVKNQDELHFSAVVVNAKHPMIYKGTSKERSSEWNAMINREETTSYLSDKKQIIFYGAPGTGKSNNIKSEIDDKNKISFRTTFHPDSDYSTFIGAYKPTKVKRNTHLRMNLSLEDLAKELGNYYSNEEFGKIGGIQRFCFDYYPYIDGEYMSVNVVKLLELAGVPKDYNVEINKYIKFCHLIPKQEIDKITYEFVPQTFTKAYVEAWNTEEDVYLIIEEINRGNCAQIFGDLFQLLDRKKGVSEYPIDADSDLADYLKESLSKSTRTDIPQDVKDGKKLMLPSNLYIWATMNTSDQSLFPIDSAFKRRWDWVYTPIKPHDEENYKIKIGDFYYDWWGFLEKINQVIDDTTSSEDKKLGYFFAKTEDKTINADKFVGKVLFYLWNDVFKNYGFDNPIFSKGENKKFTFSDFFKKDGAPDTDMVNYFLSKLDELIDKENTFKDNKNNNIADTEFTDNKA